MQQKQSVKEQTNQKGEIRCEHKPNSNKVIYHLDRRAIFIVDPCYRMNKVIGRGTYGIVGEGEQIDKKKKVAVKKVSQLFKDPSQAKRGLREIKILQFLKHKNIVSLLDIMRIQDKNDFNEIYLVLDYMQMNLDKLIRSKNKFTDQVIQYILFQILDGLQYMHSADIIHRDLKPQNILINANCELKITDMNLARKENYFNTLYVVSRPYRAIEVLISQSYNKSIDIWSVGCIFAELIGRTVLFEGINPIDQLGRIVAVLGKPNKELYQNIDSIVKESFQKIMNSMPERQKTDWKVLFPHANQQGLDLLDRMLVYDPKQRYTAEQCLNHPYLKEYRKKSKLSKCKIPFDFSFDQIPREVESIRKAIYEVVEVYNNDQIASIKRPRNQDILKQDQDNNKKQKGNKLNNLADKKINDIVVGNKRKVSQKEQNQKTTQGKQVIHQKEKL